MFMKPRTLLTVIALSVVTISGCDSDQKPADRQSPSPTEAPPKTPDTGLRVELSSEPDGPRGHVKAKVDIRDDDAGEAGLLFAVDFGDGTAGVHSPGKPIASCIAHLTPPPVHPIAKSLDFPHIYASPGTYAVTAIVGTYSVCAGPPDETRTATTTVVIE